MSIIKVKPPYKPLVQLPYCCVPCGLQWILFRRGYWVDQEEIAQYCKMKILKSYAKAFVRKMIIAKSKDDTGTSPYKFHIYANKLLKAKRIPLTIQKYQVSQVKDPTQLIVKNLKAGYDVMLDFACKPFPEYEYDEGGHVVVVSEFDTDKGVLTIGDPSWIHAKFWKVPLKKIVNAMDKKYDGFERGFWVVKPKTL